MNVLTASLPVTQEQHPDPVELNAYLTSISAAVESVPGVREVAVTSALPLQGWGYGVRYSIADRELTDRANRRPAFFKIVSPSYFDALGIRLRAGRVLSDKDIAGAPPVAIINETLAKREFPDEDPVGHRILVQEIMPGSTELGRQIAWEIVGVITGEKITGLGDEISAGMYVSNQQSPTYSINLVVRASMPPQSLQRAVRSAIDRVNKDHTSTPECLGGAKKATPAYRSPDPGRAWVRYRVAEPVFHRACHFAFSAARSTSSPRR